MHEREGIIAEWHPWVLKALVYTENLFGLRGEYEQFFHWKKNKTRGYRVRHVDRCGYGKGYNLSSKRFYCISGTGTKGIAESLAKLLHGNAA